MKVCLVGEKLPYSYSPFIHKKFGYKYFIREVPTDEFDYFAKHNDLDCFNVTVPYKNAIYPYMDEVDEVAFNTKTVNTVVKKDGKTYGYNTDVYGFEKLAEKFGFDFYGKTVMILGSGATCSTVSYVLKKHGAKNVVVVSRNGEVNYGNCYDQSDVEIIINTTPVGTYPDAYETLVDLSKFRNLQGVIDVVYNPVKTGLILQAEKLGLKRVSGLYMLVAQAKRSAEIFTGKEFGDEVIDSVYKELYLKMINIVLIGMPSCGKTVTGNAISKICGKEFFDTDAEIKKRYKKTAEQIIISEGEAVFRERESEVIKDLCLMHGKIIATGGGFIKTEKNVDNLKRNGVFVYIKRNKDDLSIKNRPLTKSKDDLMRLYEERTPVYESIADITVENTDGYLKTANDILEKVNEIIDY